MVAGCMVAEIAWTGWSMSSLQPGPLPRLDSNRQFCLFVCMSVTCSSTAHRQVRPQVYDTKCQMNVHKQIQKKSDWLVIFLLFLGSQEGDYVFFSFLFFSTLLPDHGIPHLLFFSHTIFVAQNWKKGGIASV